MSVHNVTDLERRIAAAWLKLTLHFTQTLTRTPDANGVDPESLSVSVSVSLSPSRGLKSRTVELCCLPNFHLIIIFCSLRFLIVLLVTNAISTVGCDF